MFAKRTLCLALCLLLALPGAGQTLAAPVDVAAVDFAEHRGGAPSKGLGSEAAYYDGAAQQEMLAAILPLIKARLQVPEQLEKFSSSFNYYYQRPTFELKWSTDSSDVGYEELNVAVDLAGNIQSYWLYKQDNHSSAAEYWPRLPQQTAEAIAAACFRLVSQVMPDIAGQLSSQPLPQDGYFGSNWQSFFFPRQINGLPVQGQGVSVEYDDNQQYVRYIDRQWQDNLGPVPAATGALSLAAAEAAFAANVGLELVYTQADDRSYQPYYGRYVQAAAASEPFLAYRLPLAAEPLGPYIDAFSGKAAGAADYDYPYPYVRLTDGFSMAFQREMGSADKLRPEETLSLTQMKTLLSVEELQAKLAGYAGLAYEPGATLVDTIYTKGTNDHYYARLSWQLQPSGADLAAFGLDDTPANRLLFASSYYFGSMEAVFDAASGQLLSFYRYAKNPPLKTDPAPAVLSAAARYQAASQVAARIAPAELAQCKSLTPASAISGETPLNDAAFHWVRQVNGLSFVQDYISLEVDPFSGLATSYQLNWQNLQFPAAQGVISEAEALRLFLAALPLSLRYQVQSKPYGEVAEVRLVYGHEDATWVQVEATKGQVIAYAGTPYRAPEQTAYLDLADPTAQAKVEALNALGLLRSETEYFQPQALVSQGQFISDLEAMIDRDRSGQPHPLESVYWRFLGPAFSVGEFQAEAPIDAATALKYMLRYLGFREIAEMRGIFAAPTRLPDDIAGYAAIAAAYGLIDLATWQPTQTLTRLAQAELFYAFLARP